MKIKVEIDTDLNEPEVTIRCPQIDETIMAIQKTLSHIISENENLIFKKGETEYIFPVKKILFFETEEGGGGVIAHTESESFTVEYKLYELEKLLPSFFIRVSKSTILNSRFVYGITKNITASSKIEFQNSNKNVYVSRIYYKSLVQKINIERLNRSEV